MAQTQTKSVDYTPQNVSLCMCGECPVQNAGTCAVDLEKKTMSGSTNLPEDPKQLPRLYCGTTTTACDDFDTSKSCICPTCGVWKSYDLANYKYCVNGTAEQIG